MGVHGKNTKFTLGGTTIDEFLDNVDFPYGAEAHEDTTFGKDAKTYTPGLKDGTFSLSAKWEVALDSALWPMVGTKQAFQYQPNGTGTGKPQYAGEVIVTGYSDSSPVGDVKAATIDLQISGTVTRTLQ